MPIVYCDVSSGTSGLVTAHRPVGRVAICLHSTEGHNSLPWLQGQSAVEGKAASADFLIDRGGSINQITARQMFAYHLGVASWRGINNGRGLLNQLVIGIELESAPGNSPRYTDPQLVSCAALVRRLWNYHRLDVLGLLRHGDIALPPGRRSDPVDFPAFTFTRELLQPSQLPASLVWPEVYP